MLRLSIILTILGLSLNSLAATNACVESYQFKALTSPEGAMMELIGTLPPKNMKGDVMAEGNYKWATTGGMKYSFSGNTYGDIKYIRRFPFSLTARLNSLSSFNDAITAKVLQNVVDFEADKVTMNTKYEGPIGLNTLSGYYRVNQYSERPSRSSFVQAETRAYRTMYRFIHKTMSVEKLNKLANGIFVFPFDKKMAQRALLTEDIFVKIMVEEATRSEGYDG